MQQTFWSKHLFRMTCLTKGNNCNSNYNYGVNEELLDKGSGKTYGH